MENLWFFNKDWWFSSNDSTDKTVCELFQHLLDDPKIAQQSIIEQILRYDQLPRHIFRKQSANHIILYFLKKAIDIVNSLSLKELLQMPPEQLVFTLLPWRHSGCPFLIYKAMSIGWKAMEINPSLNILRSFLRACYKRCPIVGLSQQPIETGYILSLSGGVDSMVCSLKFRRFIKAAIHISYCNRDTSSSEVTFVKEWCKLHNIPCYVREITEIQRQKCMNEGLRQDYEVYTRKVRFQCYRDFGSNSTILMGHNKTDTLENIFTNIASKSKYENLFGMTETSVLDGITFYRPLLNMTKEEVIEYAIQNKIPHLPCSTPTWSQRGQIRSSVVPVLEKWHPGFSNSLFDLSANMRDMHEMIEALVDSVNVIKYDNGDMCFDLQTNFNKYYWRLLLNKLDIKVSSKSLENFVNRLRNGGTCIVLNKDWTYRAINNQSIFRYSLNLN